MELAKLKAGFNKTTYRGPDMSRIASMGSAHLCFHRLSIMDLHPDGMQPFKLGDDYVVCNGEIYCFRPKREALSAKYNFISTSDCEILLPLYREHGVEMFAMLDAEFALIIYDSATDSLIAARDPIGIRPLFYGYLPDESIIFASEAINLVGICDQIMPFPPGHYYAGGKFVRYCDITTVDEYIADDVETICEGIRTRLIEGIVKRLDADAPLGFLLSGAWTAVWSARLRPRCSTSRSAPLASAWRPMRSTCVMPRKSRIICTPTTPRSSSPAKMYWPISTT